MKLDREYGFLKPDYRIEVTYREGERSLPIVAVVAGKEDDYLVLHVIQDTLRGTWTVWEDPLNTEDEPLREIVTNCQSRRAAMRAALDRAWRWVDEITFE